MSADTDKTETGTFFPQGYPLWVAFWEESDLLTETAEEVERWAFLTEEAIQMYAQCAPRARVVGWNVRAGKRSPVWVPSPTDPDMTDNGIPIIADDDEYVQITLERFAMLRREEAGRLYADQFARKLEAL